MSQRWFDVNDPSVLVDGTTFRVINATPSNVTFTRGGKIRFEGSGGKGYILGGYASMTITWIKGASENSTEDDFWYIHGISLEETVN